MRQAQMKKYVPDLNQLAQRCQLNYVHMLRLMPNWDELDAYDYSIDKAGPFAFMHLEVFERFQFTTTMRVSLLQDELNQLGVSLVVRLYHDARMAEVIEEVNGGCRMYRGRYDYPNAGMYQPDEKMQLNAYLGEWLANVLAHGLAMDYLVPNDAS